MHLTGSDSSVGSAVDTTQHTLCPQVHCVGLGAGMSYHCLCARLYTLLTRVADTVR